ncbi:hypothetical protein HPB48_003227 [Haemaphysalis longicornis]|uniref:PiggyBac transposable element-derived protein domain-containing protein n=1 Tax=Haemaphysalis longicornis TaxID=44386 RepID=A0A9J6FXU7_HAELO|nr:hypothetical protein HPB48_003227 [Haemaphysalis longicornis]
MDDFILDIASDDDESDGDDDDNESGALTSARVWQRVDTDNLPPAPPRFPFSSVAAILRKPTDENDFLGWFHAFFDWNIIDLTVTETNQFAVAYFAARGSTWKPVDHDEIMVFLALIIWQSIVGKPQAEMYWSTKQVFETPVLSKAMSRNRFNAMMRCLHFTNFKTMDEATHPHPRL